MARGRTPEEEDRTWRPSADDFDEDLDDEMLDEVMEDEKPEEKKHASPKVSTTARPKKGTRRTKRQDDETWKPTDEDLEAEEVEVQEMANDQLLSEELADTKPKKKASSKPSANRKKPATRTKHQDDDTWEPAGDELPDEELEDEETEYVVSADDAPKPASQTPTRKSKKRPAASSAGSPEQHKISTPAPQPTHRLTEASNKNAPDFLVRGQNDKAPFTFAAYRGEGMCMLAMNWKKDMPPDDFVGFVIEYQEPQSSKCQCYPIPFLRTAGWPRIAS